MFQIFLKTWWSPIQSIKMPKFSKYWTWLVAMLVLQLARMSTAAPMSNSTTTEPQPTTTSPSSSSIITTISSLVEEASTISSSSEPSTYSSASTVTTISQASSSPMTSTSTAESTWPDYEAVTSTVATNSDWPPFSDEIRQWPGYWIKLETDHVEAQESSVDYRTEIYHIADLFAPRKQPK